MEPMEMEEGEEKVEDKEGLVGQVVVKVKEEETVKVVAMEEQEEPAVGEEEEGEERGMEEMEEMEEEVVVEEAGKGE